MRFQWLPSVSLLFSAVAYALPSASSGALVNLRVEGATTTIFEGPIFTKGHNVTTPSGGNHHCDGTNNHANPQPGPTCTSALDDASKLAHFPFDGTFDTEFDDFFITSIGGSTQTSTQFWGLLVNFEFTPVGGCQEEVKAGDEILWAFDAFNADAFLKLTGPATAQRNHAVVFTVTDGSTGSPVGGAVVDEQTSAADGKVSVTFTQLGVNTVKATKAGTIRSNKLDIVVL